MEDSSVTMLIKAVQGDIVHFQKDLGLRKNISNFSRVIAQMLHTELVLRQYSNQNPFLKNLN